MRYAILADLVLVAHAAFVLFVIFGGTLALRWPRVAWVHLPALVWGVAVEVFYLLCPLTTLENHFRREAGQAGYEGGFIEHYLTMILYPGIGREAQFALGLLLVGWNAAVYAYLIRRTRAGAVTARPC